MKKVSAFKINKVMLAKGLIVLFEVAITIYMIGLWHSMKNVFSSYTWLVTVVIIANTLGLIFMCLKNKVIISVLFLTGLLYCMIRAIMNGGIWISNGVKVLYTFEDSLIFLISVVFGYILLAYISFVEHKKTMSMKQIRKIITVSTSLFLFALLICGVWNSSLFANYRVFRTSEVSRTSVYLENSYKNETVIDILDYKGVTFYIFEADEYIEDEFSSKVYSIVKCNQNFPLLRSYEQVFFRMDGLYDTTISSDIYGTTIIAVKESNDFSELEITLENGETKIVDVTDTKVLFYYTESLLDIESYTKVID